MNLTGKTAIVTGGGSGVGKAIATALVKEGANVVIASRREGLLKQVAEELNALEQGRVVTAVCDLRQLEDTRRVAQTALDQFSSIDFLVNNSGLGVESKIVDCTLDEWNLVMETNLNGTFFMSQSVLPTMIGQRSGYILNIASQAAKHGYANAGPYCASKFAVVGFAKALQEEVREYGIQVHSLCPALIQVPPPERPDEVRSGVLQVEDLAETTLFLFKQPTRIKFEDIGLYHV